MADPRAEQESLSRGDSVARTALAVSSDVPSTSGVSSRLFGRVYTRVIMGGLQSLDWNAGLDSPKLP